VALGSPPQSSTCSWCACSALAGSSESLGQYRNLPEEIRLVSIQIPLIIK